MTTFKIALAYFACTIGFIVIADGILLCTFGGSSGFTDALMTLFVKS